MFYSGTLLRTLAWEDSLSESSEGLFPRGKGGTRIYRSFAGKKKKNVVKHQKITDNHKKQTSQVNGFLVLFYVWEDARVQLIDIIPLTCVFTI